MLQGIISKGTEILLNGRLSDKGHQLFLERLAYKLTGTKLQQHIQPISFFLQEVSSRVSGSLFTRSKDQAVRQQETLHFADSFAEYLVDIEKDMVQLETAVKVLPNHEKHFRPGWQTRIRNAAYFAFVSHYGVHRKGEKDPKGNPLPYVQHPKRAAFDAMIYKAGVLDEETFIAELLHDVNEDMGKGMLVNRAGMKHADAMHISHRFVASGAVQVQDEDPEKTVDINRLLDLVDKSYADKTLGREATRTEALMCLISRLSEMSPEDFLKYGTRVLLIKICDRIDNDATIASLNKDRFTAIWLETCYFYLWLTKALHMKNTREWFFDLLQRVQGDERMKHQFRRIEDQCIHDLPAKFVDRIYQAIEAHGFSRGDLQIIFRPRGIRFMKLNEVARRDGTPESNGLQFNNFVNFVPTSPDPEANQRLVSMLRDNIIPDLFPHYTQSQFSESQGVFGKEYDFRSDLHPKAMINTGLHAAFKKGSVPEDSFGFGAFRVFQDRHQYCAEYMGKAHAALLLDDPASVEHLLNMHANLKSYSTSLLGVLRDIDRTSEFEQPDKEPGSIRKWSFEQIKRALTSLVVKKASPRSSASVAGELYTPHERRELIGLVHAFFFTMFGGKKQQVSIHDTTPGIANHDRFLGSFGVANAPIGAACIPLDIHSLTRAPLRALCEVDPEQGGERRRGHSAVIRNFENFTVVNDFRKSPYGAPMNGVLHITDDPDRRDFRKAHFVGDALNRILLSRVDHIAKEGGMKLPTEHLTIGTEVHQSLR